VEEKTGKFAPNGSPETKAFVAYDNQGKPVVLRRSASFRESHEEKSDSNSHPINPPFSPQPRPEALGNIRFFSDVRKVSSRLRSADPAKIDYN